MTTPINGFPIPAQSDTANIVTNMTGMINAFDDNLIPRFNLVAERDVAISSPVAGQLCYVYEYNELYMYRSSTWVSAVPRRVFKTSNQSKASTTALQNDTQLWMNIEANSRYIAEVVLIYLSGTTGDFKFRFSVPASGLAKLVHYSGLGTSATALGTSVQIEFNGNASGLDTTFGGLGASSDIGARGQAMITTSSTAGRLQLQWGQNALDGVATTVAVGSSLELRKIP